MAQVLGIMNMVLGGVQYDAEKGSTLTLGGYQQNAVVVNGKTHYYDEYVASEITFTTVLARGQSISILFARGTRECQVNCDTGQSYVFPEAFVKNRPKLNDGEGGKVEVQIGAGAWEEVLNG